MTFNRSWYATGTISVNNASTALTGSGTSWLSFGIREGDYFFSGGLMVPIAAVGSNTGITLASGWPGSNISAANYYIVPASEAVRTVVASRTVLDLLLNGNVSAEAGLTGAADKISYYTGAGTKALADYKAPMRTLGAAADMAALRTAAGLGSGNAPAFQGIAFPATQAPSADANTLDDYEEGTFTPSLGFGGASTGVTYDVQTGVYVKVGQIVHFSVRLSLTSNGSATGLASILGLPFTSSGATHAIVGSFVFFGMASSWGDTAVVGIIDPATTSVALFKAAAGSIAIFSEADFNDSSEVRLTGIYRAAA